MKVIIQIPCYNEELTLPGTLADLPRELAGADSVEWLVIDDGSVDRTAEVARAHGVDHVLVQPHNRGLARTFMTGIQACLEAGADIIVNTDADNQYRADAIPELIRPILEGRAEMVVGRRPIESIEHFSWIKKRLQAFGTWVVGTVSRSRVEDAPSGFRAISRSAAMQLNIFSDYTYTLESLIQAGQKGMAIQSVPVAVNPPTRDSRLIKNIPSYLMRSADTIVRIFMTYRPFHFFAWPGAGVFLLGILLGTRFVYFYSLGQGDGHVQSVVLTALLLGTGFFLVVIGLLADLVAVNRKLLEHLKLEVFRLREALAERDSKPD